MVPYADLCFGMTRASHTPAYCEGVFEPLVRLSFGRVRAFRGDWPMWRVGASSAKDQFIQNAA